MTAPKNNNTENKPQISLIPLDLIIPLLEPAYREGILKYQRESWRAGFNSTVMYDALMRHLTAWFFNLESCDPEAKEKFNIDKHHLGAAMFCLINLYATEKDFPELDDRPLKVLKKYKKPFNDKNSLDEKIFINPYTIKTFNLQDLINKSLTIKSYKDEYTEIIVAEDRDSNELFILEEINNATNG